jgi:hypothetical protein
VVTPQAVAAPQARQTIASAIVLLMRSAVLSLAIFLTEGVDRKPRRCNGSGEADVLGLSQKSRCPPASAGLCENGW